MTVSATLRYVRWLGGGSGAGKSTVAALLAGQTGVRLYDTDAAMRAHAADPAPDAPLLAQFAAMSMDERWLHRDPHLMLRSFPWFAGERFDRIVDELHALPPSPVTLAEGFRLLPRLVSPLLDTPRQAVWLVSTPEFRRAAFLRRAPERQFWKRTSDPVAALKRLLERDALFNELVVGQAAERGLRTITIDGTKSAGEVAEMATEWLQL